MSNVNANVLKKNLSGINNKEVDLIPNSANVVVKFYDTNPYKRIDKTDSGLIIGFESNKKYKSDETGEISSNEDIVCCAKVIAVGPDCKYTEVGEDLFCIKINAVPIPFRKMGYYLVTEPNILCHVRESVNINDN